jgi:hypothetical protein
MKNLFIIPTDKPSRLVKFFTNKFHLCKEILPIQDEEQYQIIYITSDEEIKLNDYVIQINFEKTNTQVIRCKTESQVKIANDKNGSFTKNKIILTTDQDLIKDGVQAIDDAFLEWFVQNPSCEEVVVQKWSSLAECGYSYHIILPTEKLSTKLHIGEIVDESYPEAFRKEEPKQEKCIYCENKGYIENHTGSSKIDCLQCNIIKEEPKTNLEKLPFPELVKEFEEYYKNVPLVEEKEEEPNFYEKLVEYFKNTPREKILEDWNKTAECDNIGPTVEEFLGNTQETLEEAAIRLYPDNIIKLGNETSYNAALLKRKDFIDGGNWVKERMYSEEDMREAIHESRMQDDKYEDSIFEQFKKK